MINNKFMLLHLTSEPAPIYFFLPQKLLLYLNSPFLEILIMFPSESVIAVTCCLGHSMRMQVVWILFGTYMQKYLRDIFSYIEH